MRGRHMNNARRKEIQKLIVDLQNLSFHSERNTLMIIQESLISLYIEEQVAFENLPYSLQQSVRGKESIASQGYIKTALDVIENFLKISNVPASADKTSSYNVNEMVPNIISLLEKAL